MTKQKIKLIIGLMALSSLALIAFQAYWIGYITRANNDQFGANVREALNEVVRKLEKQELVYMTNKKLQTDEQNQQLLAISRSDNSKKNKKNIIKKQSRNQSSRNELAESNKQPEQNLDPFGFGIFETFAENEQINQFKSKSKKVKNKVISINDFIQLKQKAQSDVLNNEQFVLFDRNSPVDEINFQIDLDRPPTEEDLDAINELNEFVGRQVSIYQKQMDDSLTINYNKKINANKITAKKSFKSFQKEKEEKVKLSKINNKKELMKDVFGDFLFKERPIFGRINKRGLDSLLKEEIIKIGIDTPMEYAVAMAADTAKLHFKSNKYFSPNKEKLLREEAFSASLFPNDMNSTDNKLLVNFPDRKNYLLQKVWANIIGSIAMIAIVLGCFYIALNTIIKQKNLADIKNDFINNMTHEFKTPISTISLACEVLNDKQITANPSMVTRYLGIINEENKRLGTQVEKVLQTALLEKGDLKLKLAPVNITETILKVVENIAPQIELNNGQISLDLKAKNDIIEGDNVHITNIIFNLLDNAIKYSPQKLDVKIRTKDVENGLTLSVEDTGLGLEKDNLKNIFEKFYRVPTGNLHNVKGFGLGLSYVKKMVEEHGGNISVQSIINKGSQFDIFLPTLSKINTAV